MPPKSPAPANVADWLTRDFIGSFERNVDPKMWLSDREHYALPMLVLSFCDAMAGFVNRKENDGTRLTVRFIEDEVSKHAGEREIARRYRGRAASGRPTDTGWCIEARREIERPTTSFHAETGPRRRYSDAGKTLPVTLAGEP